MIPFHRHNRRRRLSLITGAIAITFALTSNIVLAADLEIIVTSVKNNAGNVHLAIYNDPDKFPDSDGMISETEVAITGLTARHLFTGLAPGRYAVAVYHDANDNDEFDQGFLGIPLEDYAFSSGATAFLGPPSFEAAAFAITGDHRVTIPMND